MLPDTLLTYHMYAQFISLYRQLLTEVIMTKGATHKLQVIVDCMVHAQ